MIHIETQPCERCGAPHDHATAECCSSHRRKLCHRCYRRTHFVEICACALCVERAERTALERWAITPTCRSNRGIDGAWDEAVAQLREVYDAQLKRFGPTVTLTLSIARERAEGIPDYVWSAAAEVRPGD